jgi:hypothetical protein
MRTHIAHRRLAQAAIVTASAALLAACGQHPAITTTPTATPTGPQVDLIGVGQDVDKALGGLVAGPLGAAAAANPKA